MSVNVNVTINRPPLSFVHTSKYSSIIPAGFHEFVDRRFRSICKSIYSPGHAIRLLNVLRRLLHPHQHTHQKPTPSPPLPPSPSAYSIHHHHNNLLESVFFHNFLMHFIIFCILINIIKYIRNLERTVSEYLCV